MKRINTIFTIITIVLNFNFLYARETPFIFPQPQEIELSTGSFILDSKTKILLSQDASNADRELAEFLVNDMVDKYHIPLQTQVVSEIPANTNNIVMGTIDNPLIKSYCQDRDIDVTSKSPGKEGYVLIVEKKTVIIAGWDEAGAFYGLQSLRQLINKQEKFQIPCLTVRDWPNFEFRGIRLFVPGSENVAYFKRFVKDFMALYKFNKLFVEFNGFRSDRHPEINAGWSLFAKDMNYTQTPELDGLYGYDRNSNHQDAGDGEILDKEFTRNIVQYARTNFIDFIPEIPTLSHAYALLNAHPELAAYPDDIWPDVYDTTNPKTYELVFDVFDEYIEVVQPKMIHIGHDEWRGFPMLKTPSFKDRDYADLYISDVNKLYDYLTKKGVKVALWGDYLLERARGKGIQTKKTLTGENYLNPGGIPFEKIKESIPKDILVLNWMWSEGVGGRENEETLNKAGFQQLFGNMESQIPSWDERIDATKFVGGAPSAWVATNEYIFGRDLLSRFLGCANSLWTGNQLDKDSLNKAVRELMPSVRQNLSGKSQPSEDGDPVISVDISAQLNSGPGDRRMNLDLSSLSNGSVNINEKKFIVSEVSGKNAIVVGVKGDGKCPFEEAVKGVSIERNVSSLIFLHASINPGLISSAYCMPYNMYDTSELFGWYEVVYEDGFVETIPIRYGVNIREYTSKESCYYSDAIEIGDKVFYAFEWKNKRLGKKINTVNLISTKNAQRHLKKSCYEGKPEFETIPSNGLILLGLSVVEVRKKHIYPYKN
ncbi:beta-N-acetylhexosaminidase [Reichenbachiella sp. MALMAid0571]|uniref:beta-N-acetylhexosaminidase n=1 Tax=Reichenbachiella sp. MALMAid0571 TaxID=3143939 RepID=UPI0032DF01E8